VQDDDGVNGANETKMDGITLISNLAAANFGILIDKWMNGGGGSGLIHQSFPLLQQFHSFFEF
jgi:hypothetical protein